MNFEQFLEQGTDLYGVLACGVRGFLYFRSEQELGTFFGTEYKIVRGLP
ncbi:hypothetical protein MMU07_17350 [Aquiflexum sp. LQ15W]|nr:hypothetical protein [Cognataquiflexum nitidum]MCH6201353.1 hypothetical protein [Cognataquiflexum nitidum]